MAFVQYLDAHGEWQITERMVRAKAEVVAASMFPRQQAFVRVCGPLSKAST